MNINKFKSWQKAVIKLEIIRKITIKYDLYDLLNDYLDIVIRHLQYEAKHEFNPTFEEYDYEDNDNTELDGQQSLFNEKGDKE